MSEFEVIFEDDYPPLTVRARRLGDVCDFIDSEVEIEAIW